MGVINPGPLNTSLEMIPHALCDFIEDLPGMAIAESFHAR